MALNLLGIPLAMISAKILKDDIKNIVLDMKVPQASDSLQEQYWQIDNHFFSILDLSGAECNIKKTYDKGRKCYRITSTQQGQYGAMEPYLAEKGYYAEAIKYAKRKFDSIAKNQRDIHNKNIDKRIKSYEHALIYSQKKDVIIRNPVFIDMKKYIIDKEIEKLIEYFHDHNNKVYCNIIMNASNFVKHYQIWHIQEPIGNNAKEYFNDVCDKLNIKWSKHYSPNWTNQPNKTIKKNKTNKKLTENVFANSGYDKIKYNKCSKCGAIYLKTYDKCPYCLGGIR